MIIDFGYSTAGKSHTEMGTCCQDNHKILKMGNGWYLAAVADGVGSAKNSHYGSKIAVDTVIEFCNRYMPWDYSLSGIKSMMLTAYNYACKQILERAAADEEPVESYDTTLSMVIYDGHRIIYGHSGDGAIFGLTKYGDFIEITTPQKGADGVSVMPLRAGHQHWIIDSYEEELAAVMLVTDGMRETLCPYLLRLADGEYNKVYIPLGSFFADPVGFSELEETQENIRSSIKKFIDADEDYNSDDFYARLFDIYQQHIPEKAEEVVEALKKNNFSVILMQREQDDKTLVVVTNTETEVENKHESFYAEPDWNYLQNKWNRLAFPHLYRDKIEETTAVREIDPADSEEENDSDKKESAMPQKIISVPEEQISEDELELLILPALEKEPSALQKKGRLPHLSRKRKYRKLLLKKYSGCPDHSEII